MPVQMNQLRQNVRNFLMTATLEEMEKELIISIQRNDPLRARYVQEMIYEHKKENQCQRNEST